MNSMRNRNRTNNFTNSIAWLSPSDKGHPYVTVITMSRSSKGKGNLYVKVIICQGNLYVKVIYMSR